MVNNNIQGAIPLAGPGYIAKLKRNYGPGEYRSLKNIEIISSGILQQRKNISSTYAIDSFVPNAGFQNPNNIIGFLDEYALVVTRTTQSSHSGSNLNNIMWAPTSLPVPAGANSFHKIVGFTSYENKWYWITWEYSANEGTWGTNRICLYHRTADPFISHSAITFASLTRTVILTDIDYGFIFDTYYTHKDRLTLTTNHGIYMSKEGIFTLWDTPSGGFYIKFPGENINWSIPNKDSIHILCDNAIYTFTYTSDPSVDQVTRQITNTIGADHGVMYKETPYIINKYGIYQINNLTVDMITPIESFENGTTNNNGRLVAFDNYLVVVLREPFNYDSVAGNNQKYFYNLGFRFVPINDNIRMNNNVFYINMDNGAIHVIDFKDHLDAADQGYIVDVAVSPKKDFWRDLHCFFLTNRFVSLVGGTHTYLGNIYKMSSGVKNIFVLDAVVRASDGKVTRYKPKFEIEIDSFTPDGNEYLMKKFRSVEIMGTFPFYDFQIQFAYDNQIFNSGINLLDDNGILPIDRVHHPFRVGTNQRARSISIRLYTTNTSVPSGTPSNFYDQLEISDIRCLWTYTGRSNELKSLTDST